MDRKSIGVHNTQCGAGFIWFIWTYTLDICMLPMPTLYTLDANKQQRRATRAMMCGLY